MCDVMIPANREPNNLARLTNITLGLGVSTGVDTTWVEKALLNEGTCKLKKTGVKEYSA